MRDCKSEEQSEDGKPKAGKTQGLPNFVGLLKASSSEEVDRKIEETLTGKGGGFLVFKEPEESHEFEEA